MTVPSDGTIRRWEHRGLPLGFLLMLAGLTALLPASIDGFGPALPAVATTLHTSGGWAQAAMSLFVLAFAAGQILCGMLSDRFGRRPVVTGGLALFAAGGFAGALAPSIGLLIAARVLQGAGASAAVLLGRTIVRDILDREHAGRALALIGIFVGIVPVAAPLISGSLVSLVGWRAPLVALAGVGLLLLLICAWRLPETLRERDLQAMSHGGLARAARTMFGSPRYIGYVGSLAFAYAGILLYGSTASLVLVRHMGISTIHYSLLYALSTSGFIAGNFLSSQLVIRRGVDRTLGLGILLLVAGGGLMAVGTMLTPRHWAAVVVPMIVYCCGWGVSQPQMQAGALSLFPQLIGRSSALLGFAQLATGAIVVALFGQFGHESASRLGLAMAGCGLAAMAARALAHR
jgi:DHA1 family bicyclomycin/chloramphenicol resistance-like MFS transporter